MAISAPSIFAQCSRRPNFFFSQIFPNQTPIISPSSSFPPRKFISGKTNHRRYQYSFAKSPSSLHSKEYRSDGFLGGEDLITTNTAIRKNLLPPKLVFSWFPFLIAIFFFFSSSGRWSLAAMKDSSIRASNLGIKVAEILRKSSWADEAIVFTIATLPVIELRGAIPVGYWMQMQPLRLTVLSILGNMLPVPFIFFYLKRISEFSSRSDSAVCLLSLLISNARKKAAPVAEFRWLGLMLFVAVPFPGTGAWTGAIVASLLDFPFWDAVSANFFGVFLAGLLVNLIVNLGLKHAIVAGSALFIISTFMWTFLRKFKNTFKF